MASTAPRFQPVSGGSRTYSPADPVRETPTTDTGTRSGTHRYTKLVACSVHHAYRFRVAILSGAAFLGGTGLTIYNAVVGR